jgi:signal recognition particle subunit SRP54
MGPIPGGIGGARPTPTNTNTSKSGNPAKPAAENAALGQRTSSGSGAGFGLGAAAGDAGGVGEMSAEELADMQKLLGGR